MGYGQPGKWLIALSCAAACGGHALEDPAQRGGANSGASGVAGSAPASGGSSGALAFPAGGSPGDPSCPTSFPSGECDPGNGGPVVCTYPDPTCGTITSQCIHFRWVGAACAVAPPQGDAGAGSPLTCAVPYPAAEPSGAPLGGKYCPEGLSVTFGQALDVNGACWEREVALSCSAGASSAIACWVDTSTNLLYRLSVDPCMPDAKWRHCTQTEYDNSLAIGNNCNYL